jgi:hypothetical protein
MPSRCFNLNLGPRRRNPSIIARSRSFRPLCNIPCYLGPGYPFLETILVALCLRSSHLMDGVIVGENCVQIPDRDGKFSAARPVERISSSSFQALEATMPWGSVLPASSSLATTTTTTCLQRRAKEQQTATVSQTLDLSRAH